MATAFPQVLGLNQKEDTSGEEGKAGNKRNKIGESRIEEARARASESERERERERASERREREREREEKRG